MGIRFVSNSWRAPLQLIDSWLPAPAPRCASRKGTAPLMQRFLRAGWMGQSSFTSLQQPEPVPIAQGKQALGAVPAVRIVRPARTLRESGRLVISGRLADVCAELDRLAAMEQPSRAL
jgi:hypothetical protein